MGFPSFFYELKIIIQVIIKEYLFTKPPREYNLFMAGNVPPNNLVLSASFLDGYPLMASWSAKLQIWTSIYIIIWTTSIWRLCQPFVGFGLPLKHAMQHYQMQLFSIVHMPVFWWHQPTLFETVLVFHAPSMSRLFVERHDPLIPISILVAAPAVWKLHKLNTVEGILLVGLIFTYLGHILSFLA